MIVIVTIIFAHSAVMMLKTHSIFSIVFPMYEVQKIILLGTISDITNNITETCRVMIDSNTSGVLKNSILKGYNVHIIDFLCLENYFIFK